MTRFRGRYHMFIFTGNQGFWMEYFTCKYGLWWSQSKRYRLKIARIKTRLTLKHV